PHPPTALPDRHAVGPHRGRARRAPSEPMAASAPSPAAEVCGRRRTRRTPETATASPAALAVPPVGRGVRRRAGSADPGEVGRAHDPGGRAELGDPDLGERAVAVADDAAGELL